MAALIVFGVAVLAWHVQSQCIPRLPPPPQIQPQITTPVVASTIIDNSVSNALANAIQLLIVSNLIENTMNKNIANCDSLPICPKFNVPEIISPICDPKSTYDIIIPSYDPIPNVCFPDVKPIIPNYGCDCGNNYPVPNFDCGNIYPAPNIGYDCCNLYPTTLPVTIACDCPNYYPVSMPNIACDVPNYYPVPSCDCNYYPVPNFGCDQPLYPTFGQIYPCDPVGPVAAEVVFPTTIPAQLSCNFGCNNVPNLPCGLNIDPRANYIEPCGCGKPCGNGFYR